MIPSSAVRRPGFFWLLATQFFGSVNDNAFKMVVFVLAADRLLNAEGPVDYVALAGFAFIVPALAFSTYSGFLADRISKRTVIVGAKVLEILVMSLGLWALQSSGFSALLVVLFLMGFQSTLFNPAKYGILPEMFAESRISWANGLMQMWTFIAIIAGTALGGQILGWFPGAINRAAWVFVGIAVLGTMSSLGITRVPSSSSTRPFEPNPLREIIRNLRSLEDQPALLIAMIGAAYFWFLAAIFQLNIVVYAEEALGVGTGRTSLLLIAVGLGIGVGSYLAGVASGDRIEFGLVPLGSIGLSATSVAMIAMQGSFTGTLILLSLLGVSGGFFLVPLNAYVQQESPADGKGRILATLNVLAFGGSALAALALWAMRVGAHLDSSQIFLVIGLLTLGVTYYVTWVRLPVFFMRFTIYLLTHTLYRIRVTGRFYIPASGPAILVSNYLSYVDPLVILGSTSRPIVFLMDRRAYHHPLLRPFARMLRTIPISATDQPKTLMAAIERARDVLASGGIVCLFGEERPSRLGGLLGFRRGVEHVAKGLDVQIIPVCIDRIWGSIFSFERGRLVWKVPRQIPYPVTVAFGDPLPPGSSAFEVRSAVAELGADTFRLRQEGQEPLHTAMLQRVRRNPLRPAMTDHTRRQLRLWQCLAATMLLTREIRRATPDEENKIGIMLPPTSVGALLNVAALFAGKVPVNLNYTISADSLRSAMNQCDICRVWTSAAFLEKAEVTLDCETIDVPQLVSRWGTADVLRAGIAGLFWPRRLLETQWGMNLWQRSDDVATIIFSSGSTGEPKGVQLSHGNIRSNVEALYQILNPNRRDSLLGILPFFHSFGFTATIWYPLLTGMGIAYHPSPVDAKGIGETVARNRLTYLISTPTFLLSYIRRCTAEQFASLKFVMVGAEKLNQRVADRFEQKFGLRPLEGYGCTELSPIATVSVDHQEASDWRQLGYRPGSIGRAIPGVAVRIVDPETMAPLDPNEEGLMLIKGPNVMMGYLEKLDLTAEVILDGWYVTGDIARMDEDGFLTITDRQSRFSKIGGEMVPHIRVEEAIEEVLKSTEPVCAVTSVPDEKKGERLVVLYVGERDIEELHAQLPDVGLPNLWVPRRDAFYQIDELPTLGSGKLDLKSIRVMARELVERESG